MALAQRFAERRAAHKLTGRDWLDSEYRLQWETRRMLRRMPLYKAAKRLLRLAAKITGGPDLGTTYWPRVGPNGQVVWIGKLTTMIGVSAEPVTNSLQLHARTSLPARVARLWSLDESDQPLEEAERRQEAMRRGEPIVPEFQSTGARPVNTDSHHLTDRAWMAAKDLSTDVYRKTQDVYVKDAPSYFNEFFTLDKARNIPGAEDNIEFVVKRAKDIVRWAETGTLRREIRMLRATRVLRLKGVTKFLKDEVTFAVRHRPGTAKGRAFRAERTRVLRLAREQEAARVRQREALHDGVAAARARGDQAALAAAQQAVNAHEVAEALRGGVPEHPGLIIRVADVPVPEARAVYRPLAPMEEVYSRPVVAALSQFVKDEKLWTRQALDGPAAPGPREAAVEVAVNAGQLASRVLADPFRQPVAPTVPAVSVRRDGPPVAQAPGPGPAPAPERASAGMPSDGPATEAYAGYTQPRPSRHPVAHNEDFGRVKLIKSGAHTEAGTPRAGRRTTTGGTRKKPGEPQPAGTPGPQAPASATPVPPAPASNTPAPAPELQAVYPRFNVPLPKAVSPLPAGVDAGLGPAAALTAADSAARRNPVARGSEAGGGRASDRGSVRTVGGKAGRAKSAKRSRKL